MLVIEKRMSYTRKQLVRIERALNSRQWRLLQDIRNAAEAAGYRHFIGLLDEVADSASFAAAMLSDLNAAEFHRDIVELRAISAARQRIKESHFGQCVECGEEIGFERLLAEPVATRCVPCQNRAREVI
jgi:RNA polymerase-binding transcription factor DksA